MDCEKLHAFADGEMPDAEVPSFHRHLACCSTCQGELRDVLLLEALAVGLTPASASRWSHAPAAAVLLPAPGRGREITRIDVARSARRAHPWAWKAGVAAAAAAIVAVVVERRQNSNPLGDLLADARPFPARVVYPSIDDRYRPLRLMRGEPAQRPSPIQALARLEARGDEEALAAGYLLAGVVHQAEITLAHAPRTAGSDTNRAVLAMQRDHWEEARALLEAVLAVNPGHPQARWNLALVCEHFGETGAAALAFEAVAALGEPGWAEEAAERARGLRSSTGPEATR